MTVRFKNELVRNITIKLGYANAKVCVCELFGAGTLKGMEEGYMFLTYS
jgi:translation initiation factor 2 gamma subunit (eIF-2gamma)